MVHFIVRHNIALVLFSDLVKLAVDLVASRLRKLNAGKNATHTSSTTVSGLLQSLRKQVDAAVNSKIPQSPTYSVLADEVTDVASYKHLAMLCRYVKPDGSTDTVLLNDVEIADGTANTVTAAISDELQAQQLDVVNMSTLSADGASTFSGNRRGVGAQLREVSPALIYYHCRDHHLALACHIIMLTLSAHVWTQLQAITSNIHRRINSFDVVRATSNEPDGKCISFMTTDLLQDKLSKIFTKIGVQKTVFAWINVNNKPGCTCTNTPSPG